MSIAQILIPVNILELQMLPLRMTEQVILLKYNHYFLFMFADFTLLYVLYYNSNMRVRWDAIYSFLFTTSNGVKQGVVLSPIMFNLYIDQLYSRLGLG